MKDDFLPLFLMIDIVDVHMQSCRDFRVVGNCYFETTYTPGQVLQINDIASNGNTFAFYPRGEYLKFRFTNPNTWSCALGLAPSWYLYGQKKLCLPSKGVVVNGSASAEDCVCLPGYVSQERSVLTACSSCPAGTFADNHNMSQCTRCPENSTSTVASTALKSCLCNAGYSGANGGPCLPCVAGTFKDVTGSAVCTACGADKYSGTVAATAVGVCINCLANQYSATVGANTSTTCINCPGNSSSAAGSTAQSSCLCNAGYSGASSGPCLPSTSSCIQQKDFCHASEAREQIKYWMF
jgi:hypothetical protein